MQLPKLTNLVHWMLLFIIRAIDRLVRRGRWSGACPGAIARRAVWLQRPLHRDGIVSGYGSLDVWRSSRPIKMGKALTYLRLPLTIWSGHFGFYPAAAAIAVRKSSSGVI